MSIQTCRDNINLRPASRWGHTEYSLEYHRDYLAGRTGLCPDDPGFRRQAYDAFEMDFLWNTNEDDTVRIYL